VRGQELRKENKVVYCLTGPPC